MRTTRLITISALGFVMAGCGSRPKQDAQLAAMSSCLLADVLFNDDALTITNTGGRPWGNLGATIAEGGHEDNSFKYEKTAAR